MTKSFAIDKKSFFTNFIAALIIPIGYYLPKFGPLVTNAGYFALSGALTNWLAIHMLFEKIPFLYGSGVIAARFEDFKLGIKNLILDQFFNSDNIKKFLSEHNNLLSPEVINNKIDYEKLFDSFVDTLLESSYGSIINMIGGKEAIIPLKMPIINKVQDFIYETIENVLNEPTSNQNAPSNTSDILRNQISKIVENRLNELTPKMVKMIIQEMIKKHLGWLVVWGGVFGGLIGLFVSFA